MQDLNTSDKLQLLTDKNVDGICNVIKKIGIKHAGGTLDKVHQVSVMAQENLKQAAFLFHHRWRCTYD